MYRREKETGYNYNPETQEYEIAPLYWQQFEHIKAERKAIQITIDTVIAHFAGDLRRIQIQESDLLIKLSDDIGVNLKAGTWKYSDLKLKLEKES
jgi:hypothetical protein